LCALDDYVGGGTETGREYQSRVTAMPMNAETDPVRQKVKKASVIALKIDVRALTTAEFKLLKKAKRLFEKLVN
jgi:hypothetical protein